VQESKRYRSKKSGVKTGSIVQKHADGTNEDIKPKPTQHPADLLPALETAAPSKQPSATASVISKRPFTFE